MPVASTSAPLDHDKKAYLRDLHSLLSRGWLREGTIIDADNVEVPGAPKYRALMRQRRGRSWQTVEHKTHGEYGTVIPALVFESVYLGEEPVGE